MKLKVELYNKLSSAGAGFFDQFARRPGQLAFDPDWSGESMHSQNYTAFRDRPEEWIQWRVSIARHLIRGSENPVGVMPVCVDGANQGHGEVKFGDSLEFLYRVIGMLNGNQGGRVESIRDGPAPVVNPIIIGAGERVSAINILDEGKIIDHHCRDNQHLVNSHDVHLFDPRLGIVSSPMIEVSALVRGKPHSHEPTLNPLVGPRTADRNAIDVDLIARFVVPARNQSATV